MKTDLSRNAAALLVLAAIVSPSFAQREYGFDNTQPSGQPYLKPEESLRRMKIADGFEVQLFAAEPQVINPIAMTVDEKGRVWVVESFEYPKRTAKGKMPRDRIKILEDTTGNGVCDKVTIFAEGKDFPFPFDMASGIEVGHGGVFLGAPPYLWFIENKNDKPGKFEVLLKGFGSQDTHETLNTFQWGPDGRLYGLHGVFTQSEVRRADGSRPAAPAVKLNAGVWRYDVPSTKFEVFAEGTSNPWGMDWRNSDGQLILCCCVIPHLFHIAPGGIYKRQAGQSFHPYAYGYLNEICDHTFHKKSGWAHAGLISLDTPIVPKEFRDSVVFGSIHGCSIKRNVLKANGSTFIASEAEDFLVSGDKNFRPINRRWGPNGEIYCSDWHDQNPCHQAKPDSWDYEHGRIYRIVPKGLRTRKAEDLGSKSTKELLRLAGEPNPYIARTALRLLWERGGDGTGDPPDLKNHLTLGELFALWAVHGRSGGAKLASKAIAHPLATIRAWGVRVLVELPDPMAREKRDEQLIALAAKESSPRVRLELASAAGKMGRADPVESERTLELIHALFNHGDDYKDPVIAQLLWLGYERQLLLKVPSETAWLREQAPGNRWIGEVIVPRVMRRLAATGKAERLEECCAFVASLKDVTVRANALQGLASELKGRQVDAPAAWKELNQQLKDVPDAKIREALGTLSINFLDRAAIERDLGLAVDRRASVMERLKAVRDLGWTHPPEAEKVLRDLLLRESNLEIRCEACRSLTAYDSPDLARFLLADWKNHPAAVRNEAVILLATRKSWAKELLTAVGKKLVARTDLNDNTILRIRAFNDKELNNQIEQVWGRFRDSPKELQALIDKMRVQLHEGPGSFARGKQVFETHCAKCHKFEGKGHDVGPALDGAGRDIEYLLVNILDPNRVVGQPYYMRTVELKNGRIETGLLYAEDEQSITLKGENDVLKVIPKKDIEGKVHVHEKSVMPEGLAENMSVQDFRDLIRYLMLNPFLTEVQVLGPFRIALNRDQLDAALKWSTPVVGPPGRIPLPHAKKGEAAFAYVKARVTAPEVMRTRLLIGASGATRVWLNKGPVLYDAVPGVLPDQAAFELQLDRGDNVLVFEVQYNGDTGFFYARLVDPERRLQYAKHPGE